MKIGTRTFRDKLPDGFDDLNRLLPLRPITDDVHLENATELLERLVMLSKPSADQDAYLETLTLLIEDYEDKHHAIDTADIGPISLLKHLLEQNHMSASDLGRLLGQRQLGAKILSEDRELSKFHIATLSKHFKVDASLFFDVDAE